MVVSFDRVNHEKLMAKIAQRVGDRRMLKLIRAFLRAGVMEGGLVSPVGDGPPQGALSPLLSNIVLDELDQEFLGFSFTNAGVPKRRIAPKVVDRFKERVRELTWRTRGVSIEPMAEQVTGYLRGWIGYFGRCQTPSVLQGLEEWIRRRLRSAIWKQWKRGSVRFAELTARGVGVDLAA